MVLLSGPLPDNRICKACSHGTVPDRGGRISSCGLVGAAVIVECDGSC